MGQQIYLWIATAALLVVASSPPATAGPLLWQTNSEGDDIHVFDFVGHRLVRCVAVGPGRAGAHRNRARY